VWTEYELRGSLAAPVEEKVLHLARNCYIPGGLPVAVTVSHLTSLLLIDLRLERKLLRIGIQ